MNRIHVLAAFVLALPPAAYAQNQVISLPRDFPLDPFVQGALRSEEATLAGIRPLVFRGTIDLYNCDLVNTGPVYSSSSALSGGYPYVAFDPSRNVVLMHPGSAADGPAIITVTAPSTG